MVTIHIPQPTEAPSLYWGRMPVSNSGSPPSQMLVFHTFSSTLYDMPRLLNIVYVYWRDLSGPSRNALASDSVSSYLISAEMWRRFKFLASQELWSLAPPRPFKLDFEYHPRAHRCVSEVGQNGWKYKRRRLRFDMGGVVANNDWCPVK